MTRNEDKKRPSRSGRSLGPGPRRGGKKKYNKPELEKHGVLSIVEGD